MRRLTLPFAFAALLAAAPLVHAKSACMMQGEVLGQPVNDCTETDDANAAKEIKTHCNGQAPGLQEIGGRVQMKQLASCPSGAQGACVSPMGIPSRVHYYQRTPEQLAAIKQACEGQRGTWSAP